MSSTTTPGDASTSPSVDETSDVLQKLQLTKEGHDQITTDDPLSSTTTAILVDQPSPPTSIEPSNSVVPPVTADASAITSRPAPAPSSLSTPSIPSSATLVGTPPTSPSKATLSTPTPSRNAIPPPLFPRATAPSTLPPSAATRKPLPTPAASGGLKAGVRGAPLGVGGGMKIPPSLAAKMAAMTSRSNSSSPNPTSSSSATAGAGTASTSQTPITFRPTAAGAPAVPVPGRMTATGPAARGPAAPGGMMARRKAGPGLTLSAMGISSGASSSSSSSSFSPRSATGSDRSPTSPSSSRDLMNNQSVSSPGEKRETSGTPFSNFRKIVDPSGRLNFASKAVLHADGVDFSSGASFKIKMADFELFEELGQGNYGTVQKVWHKPTKVTMALKEIRLELDDSKLKTIITELDILQRATSPFIIDFYGAFFIESCVYLCMEYMDAGSLELFAGCDVPEPVLARVTSSIVQGLRFLKDEMAIMHRDVKPTNILINRKGFVKLCDFGVSGQLDRSIAKTNIGCQSYMAPERIKGESQGMVSTYTASSDVWSLGLSIIEFAVGHYPYPPETYSNVFAQLTAIVHGDPPALPSQYSEVARDFVMGCLEKVAKRRPTYHQLLEHPFLKDDVGREVDMIKWVTDALAYRADHPKDTTPALA